MKKKGRREIKKNQVNFSKWSFRPKKKKKNCQLAHSFYCTFRSSLLKKKKKKRKIRYSVRSFPYHWKSRKQKKWIFEVKFGALFTSIWKTVSFLTTFICQINTCDGEQLVFFMMGWKYFACAIGRCFEFDFFKQPFYCPI